MMKSLKSSLSFWSSKRYFKLLRTFSIDVHTHMYTPKYMDILRKRTDIPKVIKSNGEDRLIILPGEENEKTTTIGRPIGQEYWNVNAKLQYMKNHMIEKSIISLANPWLDFLEGLEAESVAQELNDELQNICENSCDKLYGFATLPVRNPEAAIKEVRRLKSLSHIKGVVMGTPGAGKGLDHENLRDLLGEISNEELMIFLHPHYGVGNEHFHDSGHSLFLALGFPFETTVCVSRLIVTGVFDQIPDLKVMVAHAGAALPSLIERLDSCVSHDLAIANRLQHKPSDYMKKMYYDAVSYGTPALKTLIEQVGDDKIMFGTDNPFFPPLGTDDILSATWPSTARVYETISGLGNKTTQNKILTQNAKKIFQI